MFKIPIKCSSVLKFYDIYVEILNCITKLSKQERKLLSVMLFLYYDNRANSNVDKLLLSTETRKSMIQYLKISDASFNNLISSLKKKNIIVDNTITKTLINFPNNKDKSLEINFHLFIHNDNEKPNVS